MKHKPAGKDNQFKAITPQLHLMAYKVILPLINHYLAFGKWIMVLQACWKIGYMDLN